MQDADQVRVVWDMVKGLMNGKNRSPLPGMGIQLDSKFSKEVLDSIGLLRRLSGLELEQAIEEARGKLNICQAMNMFSTSDLERINVELDKIV